jgi:uncharacterized membrane protein
MTPYGAPWHPLLVHFPIVLLIVAALIGVAACWSTLRRLRALELIFLTIGLGMTVITRETGEQNADTFKKTIDQSASAQDTFHIHDTFSKVVLIVFGLLLLLRLAIWGWQLWKDRQKMIGWQKNPAQLVSLFLSKTEYVPLVFMIIYLLGTAVGLVFLSLTGYYGGELVYTYGVGIK